MAAGCSRGDSEPGMRRAARAVAVRPADALNVLRFECDDTDCDVYTRRSHNLSRPVPAHNRRSARRCAAATRMTLGFGRLRQLGRHPRAVRQKLTPNHV